MSADPTKPPPERRRAPHPWSVPLRIEDVPETGCHIALTADERTRQAIAVATGLRELPRLEAAFDVTRSGHDGLRVSGQVSATVGQICVVTLEPIDSDLTELIDLVFKGAHAALADEDVTVNVDGEEIDTLVDGTVDLGALATEFLILGIDPYPRKAGAVFEPLALPEPGGGAFAALAALQKKPSN
jgi:Large ribosomal RNA subunit accumulation protein YceD